MSSASLAPTKAPLSLSALAWKATLILIPLLTAAGLLYLRQTQVALGEGPRSARVYPMSRQF